MFFYYSRTVVKDAIYNHPSKKTKTCVKRHFSEHHNTWREKRNHETVWKTYAPQVLQVKWKGLSCRTPRTRWSHWVEGTAWQEGTKGKEGLSRSHGTTWKIRKNRNDGSCGTERSKRRQRRAWAKRHAGATWKAWKIDICTTINVVTGRTDKGWRRKYDFLLHSWRKSSPSGRMAIQIK